MSTAVTSVCCPACGFSSIYTDGKSPCSVRCALTLTLKEPMPGVPLDSALEVVREEATYRRLPLSPDIRDISTNDTVYVGVSGSVSYMWGIDRRLLQFGINVNYMVSAPRSRVYRVARQLVPFLPDEVLDCRQLFLSSAALFRLAGGHRPYWHFLPSRPSPLSLSSSVSTNKAVISP